MAADVVDLVKTFQQILDRARTRPILDVDEETVTVAQMIDYLRRRLVAGRPARAAEADAAQPAFAAGAGVHVSGDAGTGTAAGDSVAAGPSVSAKSCCASIPASKPIMAEQAAVRDDWR